MWRVPRRIERSAVAPWNPFSFFDGDFSRLFDDINREFGPASRRASLPLDVSETDDAYVVEADMPGLKKDEVKIEVLDNVLTIRGERDSESEEKEKGYHRIERSHGRFHRSIEVPGGFDEAKIEARFEHGVLRITLPKREEAKPKVIEVKPK